MIEPKAYLAGKAESLHFTSGDALGLSRDANESVLALDEAEL